MSKQKIFLSFVFPCYNEELNIKKGNLEKIGRFLAKKDFPWEVIIVDDGSEDKTRELVREFIQDKKNFRLLEKRHRGKAASVIDGVKASRGEFVLFSDFDLATPIEEVDKFIPFFKEYEIIIGSRNTQRKGAPILRQIMARGFSFLRDILLGLRISDTQCGFKAFKKEAAERIFRRMRLYSTLEETKGSHVTAGFDVEFLFLAKRLGYKIKQVPVKWRYVETRRVNPLKDSVLGFLDILRIKLNTLRGVYNLQKK